MSTLPPGNTLVARAIEVAEQKIGIEELARRLNAPDTTVRAWRDRHASMPERKFLLLVDVLAELDVGWADWDR